MALKVTTGQEQHSIEVLGNTSQTKELVGALMDINSSDDGQLGSPGWLKVKDAFNKFGFKVVYDRNLVIITGALFAAIAKSKCGDLTQSAQKILDFEEIGTINKYKNAPLRLNFAIVLGDGGCIYKILKKEGHFQKILDGIGLDPTCRDNYIKRMKKITPWRMGKSMEAAHAISDILMHIRGKGIDGKPVKDENFTNVDIVHTEE